ncbi:MAG: amidohydrolase family protein, partial [Candidatus Methylomirabilales bacterium]
ISDRNIERIRALEGGIAIQHRMAFQGEYFLERYGKTAAERTPPFAQMLRAGLPVGAGTDGTRVASYNPWVALYWLVSGRTVGGTSLYPAGNRLDRMEALRLFTVGSAWFSGEEERKGRIVSGQLADLAVLSADYFSVPEEQIKGIESLLTIVGGRVVYGSGPFKALGPEPPAVSPGWAPVGGYGGHRRERGGETGWRAPADSRSGAIASTAGSPGRIPRGSSPGELWGAHGCHCFSF